MQSLRRSTLTDQAVEGIKSYISYNSMSPGDKLPSQRELCETFRVSNSVIREAIKSLETLGVVNIRSGDGIYVSDLDYVKLVGHVGFILEQNQDETSKLQDLAEARRCIESGVLELVMQKLDETCVSKLEAIVERMRRVRTSDEFGALDLDFHRAIIGITRNPILVEFCKLIDEFFRCVSSVPLDIPTMKSGAEDHARIVQLLKIGDLTRLRKLTEYDNDLCHRF